MTAEEWKTVSKLIHDVKTPLSAVIGFAITLLKNQDMEKDRQLEFLEIVKNDSIKVEEKLNELAAYIRGTVSGSIED